MIRTYDSTYPLPFKNSQLFKIRLADSSHTFRVHLSCTGPNTLRPPNGTVAGPTASESFKPGRVRRVPTILYESPSKVSGTEGADWLLDMRDRGEVGRVCIWDRPGYVIGDRSACPGSKWLLTFGFCRHSDIAMASVTLPLMRKLVRSKMRSGKPWRRMERRGRICWLERGTEGTSNLSFSTRFG